MNIYFKKMLSLFVLIGFVSTLNINGFSRTAKYSYLTTSAAKLPVNLASSYYDYRFSEDDRDENKLKKLELRALDALLEFSNEFSHFKLGYDINVVLLFDFIRLIKYSIKFLKFKRQFSSEEKENFKSLSNNLKNDGLEIDSSDLDSIANDLGISAEEVKLLLNDSELDDGGNIKDETADSPKLKSKIKLISSVILSLIESVAPLSVYGMNGDYLTKYKARELSRIAKLLRYTISSESFIGKSGSVLFLIALISCTLINLYIISNNSSFGFTLPTGEGESTRLDFALGDSMKNDLRSMDGFSDLFVSADDNSKNRFQGCSDSRCNICLEDYKKGECVYLPECCEHTFHRKCLEKAFESNFVSMRVDVSERQDGVENRSINNSPRCPMCRRENSVCSGPHKFVDLKN